MPNCEVYFRADTTTWTPEYGQPLIDQGYQAELEAGIARMQWAGWPAHAMPFCQGYAIVEIIRHLQREIAAPIDINGVSWNAGVALQLRTERATCSLLGVEHGLTGLGRERSYWLDDGLACHCIRTDCMAIPSYQNRTVPLQAGPFDD